MSVENDNDDSFEVAESIQIRRSKKTKEEESKNADD